MTKECQNFLQVLQFNVHDFLMRGDVRAGLKPAYRVYFDVLQAYLRGHTEELRILVESFERDAHSKPDFEICSRLSKIRWMLRDHSLVLSDLELLAKFGDEPVWGAEVHFVLALGYGQLLDYENEGRSFLQAYLRFKTLGARRKAIKSLQNHVAALSSQHPDKHFLPELTLLHQEAKRCGEWGMAGLALLNMSREYQKVGARALALKLSHRSLAFLRKDLGSIHYYLAVLHRAHVLMDLGRVNDAIMDIEEAQTGPFVEIAEAVKVLCALFPTALGSPSNGGVSSQNLQIREAWLPESWRERSENSVLGKMKFGELEEQLIFLLSKGPLKKNEIIRELYGETLDYWVLENRFKNLIARVRRKVPDYLVVSEGIYTLSQSAKLDFFQKLGDE